MFLFSWIYTYFLAIVAPKLDSLAIYKMGTVWPLTEESGVQTHDLVLLSTSIAILAMKIIIITNVYWYHIGQYINTSLLWFCQESHSY